MNVSGCDGGADIFECPIIYGAIPYDHLISGKVYMLVYHKDIHCPRLTSHLMCQMQSWMAGVIINELLKFLSEDPDEKTQIIIVNDPLNPSDTLVIPLAFRGVTVNLCLGRPSQVDMRMNQYLTLT